MGALTGLSGALYGAARGLQDVQTENREQDAFEADQAIRKQRLDEESKAAPLRMHSLELGVEAQQMGVDAQRKILPLQLGTAQLNLDTAQMNADQLKKFNAEADEARTRQNALKKALNKLHAGDLQGFADMLPQVNPEFEGQDIKATRNADGSITLNGKRNQPMTFTGKDKDGKPVPGPNGQPLDPDTALSGWAFTNLDPVRKMDAEWTNRMAIDKEAAKQSAIENRQVHVQGVRNEGAIATAEARAGKERDRRVASEVSLGNRMLNDALKTQSIPGAFANAYSSEDDAKLRAYMGAEVEKAVKADTAPGEAVRATIDRTRTHFAAQKKSAIDAAKKLLEQKVDPKNAAEMKALLAKNDPDAVALMKALGEVKNKYGDDIAKYLLDQLPGKKK